MSATYQNNAAVWKKKTKSGQTYLSFKAERDIKEGEWINLFANKRKTEDKHPDFTSYDKLEDQELDTEKLANDIPF